MATTGYSFDVYQKWDYIPIATVAGVVCGSALGLTLLNLFLSLYRVYKVCKEGKPVKTSLFCEDIIFGVSKLILDFEVTQGNGDQNDQQGNYDQQGNNDQQRNNDQQNDQQGTKVGVFHGRRVPGFVINFFFVPAVSVCVCACITFWVVFLMEESFGCDPGLDCFPRQENNSEILSHTPIQNCSDYDLIDNVTIVCYQFVFRYAEGFGAAGGVLVFAVSIIKMYEVVLFWAVDSPVTGDGCGRIKHTMKWIVIFIVLVSPVVCSGAIAGVSLGYPLIHITILKTTAGALQFLAYFCTFMYVATFGVIGLCNILPKEDTLGHKIVGFFLKNSTNPTHNERSRLLTRV